MLFRQYLHTEPIAASYLFGCLKFIQKLFLVLFESLGLVVNLLPVLDLKNLTNEAFKLNDESQFVEFIRTNVPPQPEGSAEIRKINQGK
ncbi:hypothetical protein [Planococcus sp. ISL-110]|uniref:hypothetical protein n=1 Tax=Planococcus sp. ISL-110 TaxID=2819167 RepID=UPI001BE56C9D|nr:hypothetical protein [Planococcus sp. ISL-110]MBT2572219.1 hypothetical protein [Planococcus sp. ISL-110]